jgi:hypothetical protein
MPRIISIDPGESAGFAVWDGLDATEPTYASTLPGWELVMALAATSGLAEGMLTVAELRHVSVPQVDPEVQEALEGWDELVAEDWLIYPSKAQELAGDKCRTARIIGALEFLARFTQRPIKLLRAVDHKGPALAAAADELFQTPLHENRHANDAIMLGWFHLKSRRAELSRAEAAPVT